jgi:DNA-binding response OmpR family regulator
MRKPAGHGRPKSVVTDTPIAAERQMVVAWAKTAGYGYRLCDEHDDWKKEACAPGVGLAVSSSHPLQTQTPEAQRIAIAAVRAAGVPILCIIGKSSNCDLSQLLQAGASDFLLRPITASEFNARADMLTQRRGSGFLEQPQKCGPLSVDVASRSVRVFGTPRPLRRAEFDLLAFLLANPGRVVTWQEIRARILRSCGGCGAVRNQVYRLRKKLEPFGCRGMIVTLHGTGCRLDSEFAVDMAEAPDSSHGPPSR